MTLDEARDVLKHYFPNVKFSEFEVRKLRRIFEEIVQEIAEGL